MNVEEKEMLKCDSIFNIVGCAHVDSSMLIHHASLHNHISMGSNIFIYSYLGQL